MKRLLSWVVIPVCFLIVCVLSVIEQPLAKWIIDFFYNSSLALRIFILIVGGSFIVAIVLAPSYYGAMLTVALSDKIYYSEKGIRYIFFGAIITAAYGLSLLFAFAFKDVLVALYGVMLLLNGAMRAGGK